MQTVPFTSYLYALGTDGSLTPSLTIEVIQVALTQTFFFSFFFFLNLQILVVNTVNTVFAPCIFVHPESHKTCRLPHVQLLITNATVYNDLILKPTAFKS